MVRVDVVGRMQPRRRGNLEPGAIRYRTVCVWLIGADICDRRPAPPCPEAAVCVCVSPSLRQQEPYSVPLLGNKWREPMLWIDAMKRCCESMLRIDGVGHCFGSSAATQARELRLGSNSAPHRLCGANWRGQKWLRAGSILPRTGSVCLCVPFFEAARTL